MANFQIAKTNVLKIEGKFQNSPEDCGNYLTRSDCMSEKNIIGTNYGIAAPTLQNYYKKPITITERDMRNLTEPTATRIYKINYWDSIKGDLIENQSIAETFFDMTFNHGVSGTVKMMQTILRKRDMAITIDGRFGQSSLDALNKYSDQALFNDFQEARKELYKSLNKPKYIKGWLNRVDKFKFKIQSNTTQQKSLLEK